MSKEGDLLVSSAPQIITVTGSGGIISEGQCDCACPAPSMYLPTSIVPFAQLVRNPALQMIPLGVSHRVGFIPSGERVAVLDEDAGRVLEAFAHPVAYSSLPCGLQNGGDAALDRTVKELVQLRFLVSPEGTPVQRPFDKTRVLVAWLHVTSVCNMRCRYCYLQKTNEVMDIQTGRAVIDAVFRSAMLHNFPTIKLKYGGGEPTLNLPLIITLHRYATELAEQCGVILDGVVLSNGVGLTDTKIETLLAHNLRLMISLDGIGEPHNSQRIFPNGSGTFQAVSHSVEYALRGGLTPDISITVSGRNIDGLPKLMAWVLERDLPFSLNFYRENTLSASETDLRFEDGRVIAGMLAAYRIIEARLPRRSLLASLLDRVNLAAPHLRPCGVAHNYLVFDCQGRIAKCQMDITNTVTDIYDPDPLTHILENKDGVQNPSVDEIAECEKCPWRYWCAGGCPLQSNRNSERYDAKSPYCNIYRVLLPHIIRLEGLRLLKYAEE